ncbi:MAG: DegT/DnrJ/EryC1/StrS family aminotransferase [Armatimonadetes bacterium]|nr:DegT/DnrJ/EryC1/StrS family aminotransferase [Armatimonadota bacterium]
MAIPFVDLKAQYHDVKDLIDSSIQEIFESGGYVLGKYNKSLEETVANKHGVEHAIAVNSGTDALRIGMQACDIQPGDEIITTAFTFVATVETIVQLGAVPVMVDINPDTFDIDISKIEAAITPRTKAIMPIHLFGQLAQVKEIKAIAEKHGLMVFEDSAQVIYAHHDGVYTGNWGKFAGISYYVTKNLGAAGDGGMILTNDDEVARRCISLRIHGMGRERYYYDEVGYTSRMAEIQAAVLAAKITKLDEWNVRRNEIAAQYNSALADSEIIAPATHDGNYHVWHQYTIRHPRRDDLMKYLGEQGIPSAIFYPVPLHLHEPYAQFANGEGSFPVTEQVSRECLSIPVNQHLSDEQVATIIHALKSFVGETSAV